MDDVNGSQVCSSGLILSPPPSKPPPRTIITRKRRNEMVQLSPEHLSSPQIGTSLGIRVSSDLRDRNPGTGREKNQEKSSRSETKTVVQSLVLNVDRSIQRIA